MRINLDRRIGGDRRQPDRSSAATLGQASRCNEAADDNESYDPYDPYWEPVKGQDDD